MRRTFIVERDPESYWLVGEVVGLSGCYSQAPDLFTLESNMKEAITCVSQGNDSRRTATFICGNLAGGGFVVTKIRLVPYRSLKKIAQAVGFQWIRCEGSHNVFYHESGKIAVIPNHGRGQEGTIGGKKMVWDRGQGDIRAIRALKASFTMNGKIIRDQTSRLQREYKEIFNFPPPTFRPKKSPLTLES